MVRVAQPRTSSPPTERADLHPRAAEVRGLHRARLPAAAAASRSADTAPRLPPRRPSTGQPRQNPPMELSAHDSLILLGVLVAAASCSHRGDHADPVPDPARGRRARIALVPGMPRSSSTRSSSSSPSCRRSLRHRVLHLAARAPLQHRRDLAARGRARPRHDVAVAWVAHAVIPGLDWPTAFVLGAIVSPTDPTAATAIAERVGLPRRSSG